MPGSEPTLHVTGDVTVPTAGYSAKLSPHTPQGINPQIYLLDLTINAPAPDQVVPQVVTTIKVQYEEKTQASYTQVMILPENITVEVSTAS